MVPGSSSTNGTQAKSLPGLPLATQPHLAPVFLLLAGRAVAGCRVGAVGGGVAARAPAAGLLAVATVLHPPLLALQVWQGVAQGAAASAAATVVTPIPSSRRRMHAPLVGLPLHAAQPHLAPVLLLLAGCAVAGCRVGAARGGGRGGGRRRRGRRWTRERADRVLCGVATMESGGIGNDVAAGGTGCVMGDLDSSWNKSGERRGVSGAAF